MRTRRFVLVFSLLVAAPIIAVAAPFPAPPVVTGTLGINIHFSDSPKLMDMVKAEGVHFIYTDFTWPSVEHVKGQYDFSAADKLYDQIASRGMQANFLLDRNNSFYGTDPTKTEWLQGYAHFAAAAAAHFKGKGVVWELWGEADNPPNWVSGTYSPSQYMAMVRVAAPAMHRADPTCKIVAPGTTGVNLSYLKTCMQEGLLDLVDGVGVDPYRQNPYHAHSSNGTPESLVSDYAQLRADMRRYGGKTLPIVCSELGWSSDAAEGGLKIQTQGDYVARMFLVNLSQGVPLSNWYTFQDAAPQGTTNPEWAYGTVNSDLTLKPAYREMQLLATSLRGATFSQKLDDGNLSDWLLVFKTPAGHKTLAAWTTGDAHVATVSGWGTVSLSHTPTYITPVPK